MTDERPTARLELRLTHPQSGSSDDRRPRLTVQDEASLVVLADVELTADQFTDLLSLRGVHAEARVPSELGVSRLFRQRKNDSVTIPPELGRRSDYGKDPETTEAIDAWAADQARGWDEHRVETNSQRFCVSMRRWLPRGGA